MNMISFLLESTGRTPHPEKNRSPGPPAWTQLRSRRPLAGWSARAEDFGDRQLVDSYREQRRLILGMPPRSTYQNWVKAVREHRDILLDLDVLTRISAVLGIYQALGILHSTEQASHCSMPT